MIFPESGWIKYIDTLAAINKTAAQKFTAFLNTTDLSTPVGRKLAIDYAYALATRYGESAAAAACEMYDAVAEASGVVLPAAEPAATATYGETAKMVNGMAKQNMSSEAMGNGVGRLVKRAGADTTLKNALRDGAEFAWVPHGDTCSFCLMLASNGWRKASKKTIKGDHAEHIHANCDCTFAIRFDGKSKVGGYDPDKYRQMYDDAKGDNWKQKLNSMRRDEYAANADKIREQKREAYERRNEKKYLGIPKTWAKDLKVSDDEVLNGTNPKYVRGLPKTARKEERDYNDNCANCVVAYEMRCRGYNVTAQPLSANKRLRSNPFSAWQDGEGKRQSTEKVDDVLEYMGKMPEGARVQIAVEYRKTIWDDRPGHTCIIARENGKNVFKDPQSGSIITDTEKLFSGLESIDYLRIDKIEVTDKGISACRREGLK